LAITFLRIALIRSAEITLLPIAAWIRTSNIWRGMFSYIGSQSASIT
jgi:hypothetical protein